MLSSRLDETADRELTHQYLQLKSNIFWFQLTALNLKIWESGNPGIWKCGILKLKQNQNMTILRVKTRRAQNVLQGLGC